MVANVAILAGNGLKDWVIQRVTALFFAGFSLFLLAYLLCHPHLEYSAWKALFHCTVFKVASLVALFALSFHAWVGIWTVTTDYLKCLSLRMTIQTLVMLALIAQFFWGLLIVWGQ
jgi:succinate dehydrogenase / fumarate reductase membrane anchor subunit